MRTVDEKIIRTHHLMLILSELREQIEKWLKEYHDEGPHKSLGHLTPREYLLTKKTVVDVIAGGLQVPRQPLSVSVCKDSLNSASSSLRNSFCAVCMCSS